MLGLWTGKTVRTYQMRSLQPDPMGGPAKLLSLAWYASLDPHTVITTLQWQTLRGSLEVAVCAAAMRDAGNGAIRLPSLFTGAVDHHTFDAVRLASLMLKSLCCD